MLRRSPGIIHLLLPLALAAAAPPSGAADLPPLRSERPPYFTADPAITLDPQGRPGVSLSITVAYPELQWVRLDRGYAGGLVLSVSFEPRDKGRIYGDVWERRVVVPGFGGTISPNTSLLEKRSFQVDPDRYRLRVTVRDLNGGAESSASESFLVPDYSKVPVGFSDLELGLVDSAQTFTPSTTRRFGLEVKQLAARAQLFDRRPGGWPRTYDFHFRILDDSGNEIVTGSQPTTVSRSAEPVVVRPRSTELFIGDYHFELELGEDRTKWRVDRSFEVEQSGPPRGREWDRMLEAMSYIAEPREIEALRALPPDQQAEGWEAFWKRRDPTPDTPRNEAMIEFFRRVRYADEHFQGLGLGWRTDMGRIYIKYGPPEQVENRPATSVDPQLEIWYYTQPYRRFVFADRDGFGHYVLVNPGGE